MPWNPFDWLSHVWPYLIGISALFPLIKYFVKPVVQGFVKGKEYALDVQTLREDMNVIKTNHLPHLQAELEAVNENISGLRSDLKDGFGRLSDSLNIVLTRID